MTAVARQCNLNVVKKQRAPAILAVRLRAAMPARTEHVIPVVPLLQRAIRVVPQRATQVVPLLATQAVLLRAAMAATAAIAAARSAPVTSSAVAPTWE